MKPARAIAAVVVCVLAGGCGSGPAPTATPSLNGEQAKSPSQILSDAQSALSSATSLHLDAQFTAARGTTNFAADIDLAHRSAHLVGTEAGGHFETIVSGGKVFLSGDATFYKAIGQQSLGDLFAGQWVIPPPSSALVSGLLALVERTNFPDCVLGQKHGSLSAGGTIGDHGTVVFAVKDAGDVPNSAPLTIEVSLVGQAFPLAVTQTGSAPQTGSTSASCSLAGASVTGGTVLLSRYNTAVSISAPANAIDLSLLGGGGPSATPGATPSP